ncbi:MAG: non-heme iron oxygenase ferredoxin subunit [Parvibaculaceae bacterium]
MSLVEIAKLHEIPEDGCLPYEGQEKILLWRSGDEVFATQFHCTHEALSLEDSWLNDDCTIECPWHSAVFNLRDGAAVSAPASKPLKVYPVQIVNESVLINWDG